MSRAGEPLHLFAVPTPTPALFPKRLRLQIFFAGGSYIDSFTSSGSCLMVKFGKIVFFPFFPNKLLI